MQIQIVAFSFDYLCSRGQVAHRTCNVEMDTLQRPKRVDTFLLMRACVWKISKHVSRVFLSRRANEPLAANAVAHIAMRNMASSDSFPSLTTLCLITQSTTSTIFSRLSEFCLNWSNRTRQRGDGPLISPCAERKTKI